MIAGGSGAAVCKLGIAGFCAASLVSFNEQEEASRRDKNRDGL